MLKKKPTRKDLIQLFTAIEFLAHENFNNTLPIVEDFEDERDYYFGILQRSLVFAGDISNILKNAKHPLYTSIFIIGRCTYDDFITLMYIDLSKDKKEAVYMQAGDAVRQQFIKLNDLVKINEKYFQNSFPFYPTKQQLKDIRSKFLSKENNLNYVQNKDDNNPENMKFKSFPNMKEIVENLSEIRNDELINRAYYFWRQWSDYVHFSSYGYKLEQESFRDLESETNILSSIQEMGAFLANNIKIVLRYFYLNYNVDPIDTNRTIHQIFETPKTE